MLHSRWPSFYACFHLVSQWCTLYLNYRLWGALDSMPSLTRKANYPHLLKWNHKNERCSSSASNIYGIWILAMRWIQSIDIIDLYPILEHNSLKTRKCLRLRRSRSAFKRIGTLSYEDLFIFRSDFFLFKGFKLKNLWWICMHWQMCKRIIIFYLFEVLFTAMKILSAISQNKKNKKGKKRTWSVGGENRKEKEERYYVNCHVSQRDEWKS